MTRVTAIGGGAAVWLALGAATAIAAPVAKPVASTGKVPTPTKPVPAVLEHSRVEVAPAAHPFNQLTVDNALGDVRVEGYDGTAIVIETSKSAPDEDALDRLRVSLVPNPDGTVRIATSVDGGREVRTVGRGAVRIDLVIRAPRDARVDAEVGTGKLEVDNMDAGGELDTSAGPISVHNLAGALEAHSVSGAMTLAQVFGSVDAQTVSSNVDLDTIGGDRVIASAHHGTIAGRRVRARDVELTTTDGDIRLEAEATLHGHIMVSSLRGDVAVRIHRRTAVTVRGRGAQVELGGAPAIMRDGWTEAVFGGSNDPAIVELRSRYGRVQFAIIE